MNLKNLLQIALRALNHNKLRCFLTMLGIIIGVASVIAMLAIGQGSKRSIKAQISEMGSNLIMIHPGNMRMGGVRQSAADMESLKPADYEKIKDLPHIHLCSPSVQASGQVVFGAQNTPTTLHGVNPTYLDIRMYKVAQGEMFTDEDVRRMAKVCVIGRTVADELFGTSSESGTSGANSQVLGQTLRFGKIPFKIIGVLQKKGYNAMGQDQDDLILAPFTSVQKRVLSISHLRGIYASATCEADSPLAEEEIRIALRENHRLNQDKEDDFTIRSQEELGSMMSSTTNLMTTLLACIAGISLLVGGIGIMNIMYVSVTERTKEIGLRMAIGAQGRHILWQFLIEAVIISISGGVIGAGLGIGASFTVRLIAGWPVAVQPLSVVLSFAVCTATGIFFGWYPARKAARLDPIEALRYE